MRDFDTVTESIIRTLLIVLRVTAVVAVCVGIAFSVAELLIVLESK